MTAATSNAAAGPGVPSSSNTTTTSTPSSTPAPTAATPTRRPKLATSTSATDSDSAPNPNAARRSGGGGRHQTAPDPLSDRATSLLIRRTLCPQQLGDKTRDAAHAPVAIEGLLPPLTSRNDVDLQLYALLAIILREFVQSWYAKVTTDDDFVAEIVHVVAHCTRALEQRCRKVDFESLVLDEIPDLVEKHITAYRAAQHPVATGPVQVDPRQVYHASYPLPPLSPVPRPDDEDAIAEQQRNEAAYRQLLVQAVLAVLLPTEDLENPCLTSLVGQILSEMIIGGALANKAAQPWLLWEGICILSRIVQEKKSKAAERVAGGSQDGHVDSKPARRWSVHGFFLSIIHLCIFLITSIRLLAGAVAASSSLPCRTRLSVSDADGIEPTKYEGEKYPESTQATTQQAPVTVPILGYKIWSCAGNLLELPSRMPWLHGILSLVQHGAINGPGRLGGLNSTVDRFLSHHIRSLFSPSHIPPLLRSIRGVLFPNNAPGKPTLVPPSTDAELLALRRRAASALWDVLPKTVCRMYLGGRLTLGRSPVSLAGDGGAARDDEDLKEEDMVAEVEGLLMVFSDEYCNKHLLYGILELILVRLMPELSEKGVEELWDERLG